MSTKEALHLAEQEGLDLIEISPNAKPPVCKIIDMGKYRLINQILFISFLLGEAIQLTR